jgi:V-type H+-transporting ATPase subunit H
MAFSGDLTSAQVLERDVPWETYMTARLISDRDLQLIRRYDKRDTITKESLLAEVRFQPRFMDHAGTF